MSINTMYVEYNLLQKGIQIFKYYSKKFYNCNFALLMIKLILKKIAKTSLIDDYKK